MQDCQCISPKANLLRQRALTPSEMHRMEGPMARFPYDD